MVNGPPTPPPTTDAELRDEAQMNEPSTSTTEPSAPPPASSTQPLPPPQQQQPLHDPYQLTFPRIAELAGQKQWLELIDVAENTEINATADQQISRLFVITPLILAYLINNELSIATLVLKRLPQDILSLPLMRSLGALIEAYSLGDYAQVYNKAEALVNLVVQPDFPERQLGDVIRSMVESFLTSFRDRTFVLLSRAYTSLSLSLAEFYFGMAADALLPVAAHHGWTYDASSKVLKPVPTTESKSLSAPAASSLANFNFIAQTVSQLEM